MNTRPFWEESCERTYAVDSLGGGEADAELDDIVRRLPEGAKVLDLGCGEGGTAIFLAETGLNATTVDISRTDMAKLQYLTNQEGVHISAKTNQLPGHPFRDTYDLIVVHGCLRLIAHQCWRSLFNQIQANTKMGGYNVVAVFTDGPPSADYPDEFAIRLLAEGELFRFYKGWRIIFQQSYMFDDEHRKGIKHRHAASRIVAEKQF